MTAPSSTLVQHTIEFRVQYNETDGQARVHHGQYANYFERGRIELLRACGQSYRDFEAGGLYLIVAELHVQFLSAAEFDDQLRLTTSVAEVRGARIRHEYRVNKLSENGEETPVVTGHTVIACVDKTGRAKRIPDSLKQARLA
ncbi:MAG: thioesterase family protein [Planctomycetota bacterium]